MSLVPEAGTKVYVGGDPSVEVEILDPCPDECYHCEQGHVLVRVEDEVKERWPGPLGWILKGDECHMMARALTVVR